MHYMYSVGFKEKALRSQRRGLCEGKGLSKAKALELFDGKGKSPLMAKPKPFEDKGQGS